MTADEIAAKIEAAPELLPFLKRIAKYAVPGGTMPPRITLGNDILPPASFNLINRILSNRCFSEKGKCILKLPDNMRPAAYWQPLVQALGADTRKTQTDDTAASTAKRLRLLFPDDQPVINELESSGTLRSFIGNDPAKAAMCFKLFGAYRALRDNPDGITLSQLGSDIFNDSKALRSGAPLTQLDKILRLAHDHPDLPAAQLRAICGIIENPYTSHVIVSAPFTFTTGDNETHDFPLRLFNAGQAVILPWETVRRIRHVSPASGLKLVTSENAAPFHALVTRGIPALYTEGYPNTSVRTLLRHFAGAGVVAEHFGDTDLDGYRIAEHIARVIPVTGLFRHGRLPSLPYKPLDAAQRARLEAFIDHHPDFPHLEHLRHTLAHGWVEQESSAWWLL